MSAIAVDFSFPNSKLGASAGSGWFQQQDVVLGCSYVVEDAVGQSQMLWAVTGKLVHKMGLLPLNVCYMTRLRNVGCRHVLNDAVLLFKIPTCE